MGRENALPTVELHQAFLCTCEDCGRDNFARAIELDPMMVAEDDYPAAVDAHPEAAQEWLEAGGEGVWLVAPEKVKCGHCGAEYETAEHDAE
jgi:hypothetical protein